MNRIIRRRQTSTPSEADPPVQEVPPAAEPEVALVKAEKTFAARDNEPKQGETFGTEFLDNLAHQMVAPLQSIERHCSNIVKGRVQGDEITLRLEEVIGHAKILSELARRMRFLQQLVDGDKIGYEQLPFSNITSIWIDGFNNYLPLYTERGIYVAIDSDKMNTLPKVFASKLAVHQVVMNLYDNALKYGKEVSIVKVYACYDDTGQYILNTFEHTASVILTRDAVSKMFKRGFRSDEAKAVRASGTGLGMYISSALMKAMEGDLIAYPTNDKKVTKFVVKWRVV